MFRDFFFLIFFSQEGNRRSQPPFTRDCGELLNHLIFLNRRQKSRFWKISADWVLDKRKFKNQSITECIITTNVHCLSIFYF